MKKSDSVWLVRFSFVFAIFFASAVNAQQVETEEEELEAAEDTATVVSALDIVPEILEEQMDSPVSSFLLKDRLKYLQNEIPLRYNEYSHQYVDFFVNQRPAFTRRMLETKDLYFPIFERALSEHNLPEELKYLPLIESGLDPRIISRAGAGGLWQFMRATGRELGLRQNQCIDERFHPEKSTEAACKYLKQLYNIFGDWEMALAAYNCGPGNIRRAIRRTGRSDFWGIYSALPKETRNYVPQFVAMVYLMNYSKDHGIVPGDLKLIPVADTLNVNGYLNLHTFAALGGMSLNDIYEHNPHLVGTYIPQSSENFRLKIPATKAALISDQLVAILDSSSKVPAANAATLLAESRAVKDGYEIISTKVRHTVRSGQTLSSIARQHRVTVSELKSWNRLRGSMLKKGQKLVVVKSVRRPVKEEEVKAPVVLAVAKKDTAIQEDSASTQPVVADLKAEAVEEEPEAVVAKVESPGSHMTESAFLERQAARLGTKAEESRNPNKVQDNKAQASARAAVARQESKPAVHTIRKGETLISIANKYDVEVDDLKKLNKLQGNKLVAGKKLQIAAAADPGPVRASAARSKAGAGNNIYHVVQSGDTLWAISRKYGLSVDWIKKVNNIKGNALKAGMKILISG